MMHLIGFNGEKRLAQILQARRIKLYLKISGRCFTLQINYFRNFRRRIFKCDGT